MNIHKTNGNIYITSDEEIKEGDWMGMFLMAFVNLLMTLPMNHFSIECKTFKDRFYIALAFAIGFGVGVVAIT